jgi:hypothetical protein
VCLYIYHATHAINLHQPTQLTILYILMCVCVCVCSISPEQHEILGIDKRLHRGREGERKRGIDEKRGREREEEEERGRKRKR